MKTSEFFKRWLITNMCLLGAALVTNSIVTTYTGKPISFVVPGFTTTAMASEIEPKHAAKR